MLVRDAGLSGGGAGGADSAGAGAGVVVDDGAAAAFAGAARVTWGTWSATTVSGMVATATFAGAVMCAAYYAANNCTNDKDDDDDDRCNPPSRAIPPPFRAGGLGTILQLPFLAGEGHGAGAVASRKWLLVCRLAIWGWRGGRAAFAAFV